MRIKLVGKDLFKYKDDRVERLGPMWEAKCWMERLMTKEDWNAIERKDRERTIEKLRRQIDYREAQGERVTEIELQHDFIDDAYELIIRYESGGLERIDSKTIMSYCGIKDLERRLGPKLRPDVELMIRHKNGRLERIDPETIVAYGGIGGYLQNLVRQFRIEFKYKDNVLNW